MPPYLGLWIGLVSGARVGGLAAIRSEGTAIAGAAVVALLLAGAAYAAARGVQPSRRSAVEP